MANRYTNEGRDPRDLYDDDTERDDIGNRPYGRQQRFTDSANRGTFRDRGGRGEENYFGSGRQGYGDGIGDVEPNHSFGSSWRDSTGYSNYETPRRRYESTERRAGFGRDAFGLGYGGDWEPEANRRREWDRDRSRSDQRQPRQMENYRDYPSTERGYYNSRNENRGNDRSWWDRASDEVSSWFGGDESDRDRQRDTRFGGHRGRGPKNYTRSDDRIKEDINDRLTDHDNLDASDIDVDVQNGEVVLTGSVNTRYEKRMAEDIAEDISGVKNVENRIRVNREQQYAGSNLGYSQVTGHGELNRQEVDATQGKTTDQGRSATGRS